MSGGASGAPDINILAIILQSLGIVAVSTAIAVCIAKFLVKNGVDYKLSDMPA